MKRYVLRFRGTGPKPAAAMDQLRLSAGLKILDDSASRMVLVESAPETIATLQARMPDWLFVEEGFTPLPDPRPKLK